MIYRMKDIRTTHLMLRTAPLGRFLFYETGSMVSIAQTIRGLETRSFTFCNAITSEGIQLANLGLRISLACSREHNIRHARFNEAWANGVDPYVRLLQLKCSRLRHVVHPVMHVIRARTEMVIGGRWRLRRFASAI